MLVYMIINKAMHLANGIFVRKENCNELKVRCTVVQGNDLATLIINCELQLQEHVVQDIRILECFVNVRLSRKGVMHKFCPHEGPVSF